MRLFLTSLILTCKRFLCRRGMLAAILALPVLCAVVSVYLRVGRPVMQIRVGVAFDPRDSFAADVFGRLSSADIPVEFTGYLPGDRPLLEELVSVGELECAYILTEQLEAQMVAGRGRGGLVLIKSPQTVADVYVGEMIYSALLYRSAPGVDAALLGEVLGVEASRAEELVRERFDYYERQDDIFMQPEIGYYSATLPEGKASPPGGRVLHGIIALFLLAISAGQLLPVIEEKESILARLTGGAGRRYMLGVACGLVCLELLAGGSALAVTGLIFPGALSGPAAEAGWLALYVFSVCMPGILLALLLKKTDLVYGGSVFVIILSALLGGAFADVGEFSRVLAAFSRVFPSYSYIDGILTGRRENMLVLGLFGLVGLAGIAVSARGAGSQKTGNSAKS